MAWTDIEDVAAKLEEPPEGSQKVRGTRQGLRRDP